MAKRRNQKKRKSTTQPGLRAQIPEAYQHGSVYEKTLQQ